MASPTLELEAVSVDDPQAFAAEHLSDLKISVKDFKKYSWRIPNYTGLPKRVTSDTFTVGGHEWNILLFPQGNSNRQASEMVSIYLNYEDSKKQPEGWRVYAQFALAISNPHDGTCYIQSQAQHQFTKHEPDWGFTKFVELRKLSSPADSRVKPIIENDETIITAYVRVLCITQADTPAHLESRLEREQREHDKKKREKKEMQLHFNAKIITDKTFRAHQGFDLALFNDRTIPPSDLPTFQVARQQTFQDFKSKLAQDLGYQLNQIRLWVLVKRQNKTVRPDTVVPEHDPKLTMEVVRDKMASKAQDLKLYLEVLDPAHEAKPRKSKEKHLMIFVKYFNFSDQTLTGVGHFYVHQNARVGEVIPLINARMYFPKNTSLKLYEEIKPGRIDPMKPKATFLQSEIQDGDIICFQIEPSDKGFAELKGRQLYLDPVAFYDFLANRVLIQFKPRYDDNMAKSVEFDLLLSKKLTYDQMATRVGERLQHDPMKLRFTNSHQGNPKNVIYRAFAPGTVADMIQLSDDKAPSKVLFYERLDMSIVEIETKCNVKVAWTGAHHREKGQHSFLMPKNSSMHDGANELSKLVKFSENSARKIKLFTSQDGRIQKQMAGDEILRDVADVEDIYAKPVPQDELTHGDEKAGKIIEVDHFQEELTRDFDAVQVSDQAGGSVDGDKEATEDALETIVEADVQNEVLDPAVQEQAEKDEKDKADEKEEKSRVHKDLLDWEKQKYEDQRQEVKDRLQLERDRFKFEKDQFEKAQKEKEDRMNTVKEWIKEGKSAHEIEFLLRLMYGTQSI
ncbi:hypothetical protein PCANC_06771 [Puccinia coronata f. sp. avenae]|uniref:ubiquitinyl hydrolase 1 n=1 Tax=Puccinia coronata f. sp. avenae TaxID=200324 RepID=A0A2N5VDR1_9BASI|nr:hypothetical protein PCANC_06771 [Puccinia coronata f. sp. avenae]